MSKFNRRSFIQLAVIGIGISFTLLWSKLLNSHSRFLEMKKHILPFDKNKKVSFFEDVIVINKEKETSVFSSHCTHLGCTISSIENDMLVCPCHGSRFNLEGKPTKGPAFKSLEKIQAELSEDKQFIHLKI